MTTSHYSPQTYDETFPRGLRRNIAAAYAAAGLEVPPDAERLTGLLAAEPTHAELARTLAAKATDATDAAEWLEDAVLTLTRAAAVDALRPHLNPGNHNNDRASLARATPQAAADLTPHFRTTVASLRKAAGQLPAGWDALDVNTNLANHTSRALEAATTALTDLSTLARIYPTRWPSSGRTVPREAVQALRVLDVPTVTVERVDHHTGESLDTHDGARATLRAFISDVKDHGVDAVLIHTARGGYGDTITFSLPADVNDFAARAERLNDATRNEAVVNGAAVRRWGRVR